MDTVVFDISYNQNVKDILFFLQEKIAGIPDPGFKKTATYSNITSAIEFYLDYSAEGTVTR